MKKVVFLMEEKDRSRDEYSSAIIWWYGILEKMGYEVLYYDYYNFNFETFFKEVKEFHPDFIFHPTYDQIHTEFVRLHDFCKTYVIHSDDDFRFNDFAKYWAPFVTGTISFCGGETYMKQLYNSIGISGSNFIKAYWCFNPNTMSHNHHNERNVLLSHIGGIYGERDSKINQFFKHGVSTEIYNNKTYEDFKKLLSQCYFSLSLTKSSNLSCNQVKGRIFEIPFSCALLTEPFPDMEKYYDIDKEILVFNSVEEGCQKLRKCISDNTYFELYNSGRKRLLSEHTAYHVWNNTILPVIDEDYKQVNVNDILKNEHGL